MQINFNNGVSLETESYPETVTKAVFSNTDTTCTIHIKQFSNPDELPFHHLVRAFDLPIVEHPSYGEEYVLVCGKATTRFSVSGDYVRVYADGEDEIYWTIDEFLEDPELVFGAMLGAIISYGKE